MRAFEDQYRPARFWRGRLQATLAMALAGALAGALLGLLVGRATAFRAAEAGLAEYAQSLSRHGDELFGEIEEIFRVPHGAAASFCSEDELAMLRAETFRSRDLKDIGRTRQGMLYCSALLGRMAHPYREGSPTLTLANGDNVYANVAVVLATSSGGRGTVIESGDTDVVLSPEAFDHWSRPQVGYLIAVFNPGSGQYAPIAAANWSADSQWNLTPGFRTAAGVLSQTQCSPNHSLCAITSESLADVWTQARTTQASYEAMGALAGLGLGFAAALAYLRKEGLRHQLRKALLRNSNSLSMVYEPIIDLSTGRCTGAEALMRWTDQDGAAIAPDVFIRLAEDSGFIGLLTSWVLQRSIRDLGGLLRQYPAFTLSVNVAASDINGEWLAGLLERCVLDAGIEPSQIVLELTERSTADLGRIGQAIEHLAALGYKVHIDDFGTGFSSLSYLDRLAVHAIKVDRSFTRTIGTEAVTVSILPQMMDMAESLHLEVIVEGVETEAQLRYLNSTQRPLRVQGWFFGRSMTPSQLAEFLDSGTAPAAIATGGTADAG